MAEANAVTNEATLEEHDHEALIVLTGITADREKKSHVLNYFQANAPFTVFLPDLRQYFGIHSAAKQLRSFLKRHKIEEFKRCHFLCYISGGYILRCALGDEPLANLGRVIYVRSPLQERVPALSIAKYGRLLAMLMHGKILFDLAADWKEELPGVDADDGFVIEQGLSVLAGRLGLDQKEFETYRHSDRFLIPENRPILPIPLSHDEVYSNDILLGEVAAFIESGRFPVISNALWHQPTPSRTRYDH